MSLLEPASQRLRFSRGSGARGTCSSPGRAVKRSPGASWSKYEFQKAWNRKSWTMLENDWMEMYPEMTL
eukprot:3055860-Prymnesium_polylepis.1